VQTTPYYLPVGDEVSVFAAAWAARLPILLKGPTGCGKTRFVEHMAARLYGGHNGAAPPLVTVACHEDLTGSDLVGRYLLKGDETVWVDGPLTQAVRHGGICYLDEIVEARKDTVVLIHPLTDHRRILPIDKKGEILDAHPDFVLVISYNPGYQSALKDLKPPRASASWRSTLTTGARSEARRHERRRPEQAMRPRSRREGAEPDVERPAEGVSTRPRYAGQLIRQGVPARCACTVAVSHALTTCRQPASHR
jgi:nitric oxide reductase NorQ protein